MVNSSSPSIRVKKKRKPTRSCTFCRQRKLKCDLRRPICSSCKSRQFTTCIYPSSDKIIHLNTVLNYDSNKNTKQTTEATNSEILQKVNKLERQIDEIARISASTTPASSHNSPQSLPDSFSRDILHSRPLNPCDDSLNYKANMNQKNPLNDFFYVHTKFNGRKIVYGPTSLRTNVQNHRFGFGEKFRQLWSKIKYERIKWKQDHNMSMLRELQLLEDPYDKKYDTLLQKLCKELPSYEICLASINRFFDPKFRDIYLIGLSLDKSKVLNDFYNSFIGDNANLLPNGEKSIKELIPAVKKNYYKIGVIIMILAMTHYYQYLPPSVEYFIHFLTGNMTAKVLYVERAQFLLLRCHYSRQYIADCDDSHIINLVSLVTTAATMLGLDRNIEEIYRSQENNMGSIQSLRNMWYIILYLDFEVAFQIGKQLELYDVDVDYDQDLTPLYDEHLIKLRKFLKLGRSIVKQLMAKRGIPNLRNMANDIIEFAENELPPISHFLDTELLVKINLNDVRIISLCIEMILVMNGLRFAVYKELTYELSSSTIHMGLLAIALLSTTTDRCFNLDKKYFPELFDEGNPNLTPYATFSIGTTAGLVQRSITAFAAVCYYRLTIFLANDLLFSRDYKEKWDYCSLKLKGDPNEYSVIDALELLRLYSNSWLEVNNVERMNIMKKSYYFVVSNAMQRTFQTLLDQCIEYRKKAEISWLLKLKHETGENPALVGPTVQQSVDKTADNQDSKLDVINTRKVPEQIDTSQYTFNNKSITNVNPTVTMEQYNEKESEMLQQITDEFWSSFDVGWDELLEHTNPEDLFNIT